MMGYKIHDFCLSGQQIEEVVVGPAVHLEVYESRWAPTSNLEEAHAQGAHLQLGVCPGLLKRPMRYPPLAVGSSTIWAPFHHQKITRFPQAFVGQHRARPRVGVGCIWGNTDFLSGAAERLLALRMPKMKGHINLHRSAGIVHRNQMWSP
jgi:hypothetical protein